MKTSHWLVFGALLAALLVVGPAGAQDDDAVIAAEADEPEGVEVLTRGPIHEAFATPVTGELKPTFVIPKEPPADIDEVPPDFKPEGDDVVWIPGYWSWDDEREDFIWVSGVWRRTPPNQRWVPGYWDKIDDGWRWSPGFWAPVTEEATTYYDPPPETLEAGPSSSPPSENHFWTPGVWTYYETGYRWRPGYWAASQPNWIWMPDHWVWTPSGAVFVPGYWDYTFATRGCVFSPVYITNTVYTRPGFFWRPRYTLNPAALLVNFWIRPNYCHYYFGNYYGGNYGRWGYTPMAQYYGRRGGWGWDPIIAYNQAYYGGRGINYVNRMNSWHQFYVNNPNRRPPSTWHEQVNIVKNQNITVNKITNITNVNHIVTNDIDVIANGSANVVALPINQVAKARRNDSNLRLAKVDDRQREKATEVAKEFHQVNRQRSKIEKENAVAFKDQDRPDRDAKQGKVRNSVKLPTVAKVQENLPGRDKAPARNDKPAARDTARDDKPKGRDDKPTARDAARDDKPKGRDDKPAARDTVRDDKPGARDTARDDKPKGHDDKPAARDTARPGRGTPNGRDDRPRVEIPPASDGRTDRVPKVDRDERPGREPGKLRPDTGRVTPQPERRPEPQIDRPAPRPDRPEARPEPRRTDKPEVRPEPRPKIESRPEPRRESRPEPRIESRPQPRNERPQPNRPERKPEPQRAEKPIVREQPRPQPMPQPRPQPKPEARPQPRAESRPAPRAEPPHPPKSDGGGRPDAGGKPNGAGKGKDRDKDKDKKDRR